MSLSSPHPKVVALLNHKGGVGKTSTTANLAAEAAARGMKVLLVDMDKQASLTTLLGIATDTDDAPEYNVNDVIASEAAGVAADATIASAWEGVDLIPSSLDLAVQESNTSMGAARLLALGMDDAKYLAQYDLILIDCAPSLGMVSAMALTAADEVLLVTEPESPSLKGIHQTIRSIQRLDGTLKISGLVVNKFRARTKEHADRLDKIKADPALADLLWEPLIPQRTAIAEAAGRQEPLAALGSKAEDVRAIYQALLDHLVEGGE